MSEENALIFGDNDYTAEINKNISKYYNNVHIFTLNEDKNVKNSFDLGDDWDDLSDKFDMKECSAFCILEDIAQNIFLTISLRDAFPDLNIIALAQDKETEDKLNLAGASRILPATQTTANVIVDMLDKPIVTEVFHNILYEKSLLKIAEIKIEDNTVFDGKYPSDIEWSRDHGVLVISVVHEDGSKDFIYSSKSKHHPVKSGDIFVLVGYEEDIKQFKRLIGTKCEN